MRFPFVVAAAAILGLSLAACQPQSIGRPPCPAGKRCLEYGNGGDPQTLDPQRASLTNDYAIIAELIQGLTENGPNGEPVPGMAERWETSADGLVWTFHLRKALWSDGVPVTAHDFVFAYRRMLDPHFASNYSYMLYFLKNGEQVEAGTKSADELGVKAIDDLTLQLTLEHPAPYMLQLAKHQTFYPVPAHTIQRWGDAWTLPSHYVSNGPYMLTASKLGDYVRIEKNPRFWDAKDVCIDRIDFYPTTDTTSAERRVKRGELDVNNGFQSNRIDFLRHEGKMADYVRVNPYLLTAYITFNTKDVKAFRDVRVRQALSMDVDRDFLTTKLLRAGQVPTTAFVPGNIAGYVPPAERPRARWADWPFERRQAEARRLLAEAGYGPGHPLKFKLLTSTGSDSLLVPQALQAEWRLIGVDVTITQQEGQIVYQSLNTRDFEMSIPGWVADYNDPKTYLDLMKSGTGQQNYGDYSDPKYDALLNAADLEPDINKRAKLLAQAEQIMLDDANVAPLYNSVNRNLVSPRVTGWTNNALDVHRALYLCLKDAAPGGTKAIP
ncbi:MAG: peptide ABC transporter substrate-binding protein [Caulobacterales bacterium]